MTPKFALKIPRNMSALYRWDAKRIHETDRTQDRRREILDHECAARSPICSRSGQGRCSARPPPPMSRRDEGCPTPLPHRQTASRFSSSASVPPFSVHCCTENAAETPANAFLSEATSSKSPLTSSTPRAARLLAFGDSRFRVRTLHANLFRRQQMSDGRTALTAGPASNEHHFFIRHRFHSFLLVLGKARRTLRQPRIKRLKTVTGRRST